MVERRRQLWRAGRAVLGLALLGGSVYQATVGAWLLAVVWVIWGAVVLWGARELRDLDPMPRVRLSPEYSSEIRALCAEHGRVAAVKYVQQLSAVGLPAAMTAVDEALAAAPPVTQAATATSAPLGAAPADRRFIADQP